MATILDEDFEGGTHGADLTTSNTTFGFFNGSPTFTDANPFVGDLSMHVLTSASASQSARIEFNAEATLYVRAGFRFNDWPSSNTQLAQLSPEGSSTALADVRATSGGSIHLRVANTAVWTASASLTAGQWYQVVWGISGANIVCDLHDADGALIATSGNLAYGGGSAGRVYVGANIQGANLNYQIDAVQVDNATKPEVIGDDPEPETYTHFYISGGQLHPLTLAPATGGEPEPSPGVWWSHYDQQSRPGQPTDSNPAFDAFEWAMKDRMASPPSEPIGSFIRGYSGPNFPSTFQASSVSSAPSRGIGAMLNVKRPDWQALASGAYDSTITSFFNSWPVETFGGFTINHEPENDGPTPANPSNPDYVSWASVNGPIWSQGIARTIAVAAPIIRARGLDVKLGGCLMDFSWDTTRWQYWDWWNYVDSQYLDVVEFQLDAYTKTVDGNPPYGHDLIPRIMECYQHGLNVGINYLSLYETACDRRERHGGDNMVGTDESVAVWWEGYGPAIEAIPGARMMGYFSIPTGPASGQAAIMGRGLDVFRDICLNGRRP